MRTEEAGITVSLSFFIRTACVLYCAQPQHTTRKPRGDTRLRLAGQ